MVRRRPAVAEPVIDRLVLEDLEDADPAAISAHRDHRGLRFEGADLSERGLAGVEFHECEFLGVSAGGADMRGARFIETRFDRLDAPALRVARSFWRDVAIESSRLGAVEAYEAELRSVRVAGSKLDFVNLRTAVIRDVLFERCVIGEIDLGQCQAERVAFADCTIGEVRFDGARLKAVDLRGARLSTVGGLGSMAGVVVTSEQASEMAPLFARHLGIAVME